MVLIDGCGSPTCKQPQQPYVAAIVCLCEPFAAEHRPISPVGAAGYARFLVIRLTEKQSAVWLLSHR
ncbi:hypothetical protein PILCRDRAFT_820285 [Piloderma croceum F 1598]|uniref:Uncharacterized protein n=1 Tax=Piloderma croceum (strain F 1598) TaxID=765440 RepID=A0A0C3FRR4_PILCF|nr:hypothetical protein PILCRDRAFT_820285 [Piloderma croceum F 1598]